MSPLASAIPERHRDLAHRSGDPEATATTIDVMVQTEKNVGSNRIESSEPPNVDDHGITRDTAQLIDLGLEGGDGGGREHSEECQRTRPPVTLELDTEARLRPAGIVVATRSGGVHWSEGPLDGVAGVPAA